MPECENSSASPAVTWTQRAHNKRNNAVIAVWIEHERRTIWDAYTSADDIGNVCYGDNKYE